MSFDLIAIGDPTVDTFLKIHEAHLALRVNPSQAELCIDYADKIPVDDHYRYAAGGGVNVSTSVSRLGLKVAYYGVTGEDAEGESIRSALGREGVDISLMDRDSERGTNASTALVFRGERTIFVWHQPRRYLLPALPVTGWIYLTSLGPPGPYVERLHAEVCRQVDSAGLGLAFNPGTHQLRMGAEALSDLLRRTRLLVVNRQEAMELSQAGNVSMLDLLKSLHRIGPRVVVITDGAAGSYAFDGNAFLKAGILETPVVDRTGAGDAYTSAVLTAHLLGRPLNEAMAWGSVQAAHVVQVYGATPGLVRRHELEAELALHPELIGVAV